MVPRDGTVPLKRKPKPNSVFGLGVTLGEDDEDDDLDHSAPLSHEGVLIVTVIIVVLLLAVLLIVVLCYMARTTAALARLSHHDDRANDERKPVLRL